MPLPPSVPEHSPALVVTRPGDRSVLEVQDRPTPEPGAGEVIVKVAATGVNFIDVYHRQGVYPIPTPFVLGTEGAGEVVAVGPDVSEFVVGDRVGWVMHPGAAAAYAVVPQAALVPVPAEIDDETAAAVLLQGMTAHFLTHSTYAVGPGTTALVHAAAGGVGQLLVQYVVAQGGTVIATAGGPEKAEKARARGASTVLDYRTVDDLAAAVREANDGQGVDVVYDGVGKDTFDASLASLRARGLMVLFGGASGQVPPFDLQRLNTGGSLFITRPSLAAYVATPAERRGRAADVFRDVANGTLTVEIGGRYPLAEAVQAYAAVEGRQTQGKLILIP
jgi:NADPH2:quinone reductase